MNEPLLPTETLKTFFSKTARTDFQRLLYDCPSRWTDVAIVMDRMNDSLVFYCFEDGAWISMNIMEVDNVWFYLLDNFFDLTLDFWREKNTSYFSDFDVW